MLLVSVSIIFGDTLETIIGDLSDHVAFFEDAFFMILGKNQHFILLICLILINGFSRTLILRVFSDTLKF